MACIMLVYNATSEYHVLYPDVVKEVQNSYLINVFLPFLFIPFFVQRKDISSFVNAIPMWGVIYLFVLMITFHFDFGSIFQDRAILYESSNELVGTIQLARTSCITLLALLIMSFQRKIQKRSFLIMIAFACISLFFLLGAGQRGMLIGFLLSLLLLLLNNQWRRSLFPIYGVLIILLLVAGLLIVFGKIEIFQRFSQFNDVQSFNRYWDYGNTWEIFRENSYFYGLGTKGYFFQTGRIYPHNIILEHISDYGLIGLICILVLIICCLKYSVKAIRYSFSYQSIIIASCWIALCFEAMVSDGINGQRMFYIFSGLLALCYGGKRECSICCKGNVSLSS
jgi:O-Antigen ligase.